MRARCRARREARKQCCSPWGNHDRHDQNATNGQGLWFYQGRWREEYFFHQSAVQGEGINDLREGDSVEFEVGDGPKGPRAEKVRRPST